ncbi:MAG TPA: prolyl oligopeptidase family serine peptidase, partial [Chlamydiales bacterium]|nr:prolyl oligopeptidase family serine peptidase [Chlamydiales bacterium]
TLVFHITAEDAFNTEFLSYNSKEKCLYMLDNRGSDTTQLKKISESKETVLAHHPESDIADVLFKDGIPVAYATNTTQKQWHPLTDSTAEDLTFLAARLGPNFEVYNQSNDTVLWIVKNSIPEKGKDIWLYNRAAKSVSLLFSTPNISNLSKMYPIVIQSRDGLELVSYLTLPQDQDNAGRAKKPLPLVVIPHGGPFKARDTFSYSPYHQWLSNRGYAVLSVNFRLSSGFGKAFVNAGNKQWGKKAHEDILDAVQWCIDQSIADKNKIAIFGGSYGGFEALSAITYSPDVFACAVDICGPSNLRTVLQKCPFYWELSSAPLSDQVHSFTRNAFITSIGGDPESEADRAFLENASPINHIDNICKPLLLIHGKNDPIVVAAESDQIFEKMEAKKLPAIYLSFANEGHGLLNFSNNMSALAYSEWLLSKVLGGTYEPLDKETLDRAQVTCRASQMNPSEALK